MISHRNEGAGTMDREAVLARWESEEAAVRAKRATPGVASIEDLKAGTGIEFLRRIIDGTLPPPPISETLGFVLVLVEPGRAVFQGTPDRRHYNPLGSVHGGYFCTLLDSALGCAVQSTLPKGTGYTTLELKVNLIRPLHERVGPVRADARIINVGARVGIAEASLTDVDGKIYAHATTTCLIFPLP
jgi:uncharacterized protein (TIGR00369 family)